MAQRTLGRRLRLRDIFGISPLGERLRQTFFALRGSDTVPATRWGLSSLRLFRPSVSLPIWLGRRRADRRVPIFNFFNRTQTPAGEGWSVRVTQVRDFRGGRMTYDSHNGTDFAVPVGTVVTAPADGRVFRVRNEYHRGGLKVFIDHGRGVATNSAHLAAALVEEGDLVKRGEPYAISGASGLDMTLFVPWIPPHVHFNVFLNGVHVDPFPEQGSDEESLWLGGGDPKPPPPASAVRYEPSEWDEEAMAEVVASCRDPEVRARLEAITDPVELAGELLFETAYFPTRFARRASIYAVEHPRQPLLSLPFAATDFVGVAYPLA